MVECQKCHQQCEDSQYRDHFIAEHPLNCEEADKKITAYCFSKLGPTDYIMMNIHLDTCKKCLESLRAFEHIHVGLN